MYKFGIKFELTFFRILQLMDVGQCIIIYFATFFKLFGHMSMCLPQCFIFGIALMYSTTLPLHFFNCTSVVVIK